MSFTLKQVEIGPMLNFCYLIGDNKTKEALVVDPAWAPQEILSLAEKMDLRSKGSLFPTRITITPMPSRTCSKKLTCRFMRTAKKFSTPNPAPASSAAWDRR